MNKTTKGQKMETFLRDYTKYTDKTPGENHRDFSCDEETANKIYKALGAIREENCNSAWVKYALVIDGGEGVLWMSDYNKPQNRIYVGCEVDYDGTGWFVKISYSREGTLDDWKKLEPPRRKWSRSLSPSLVCQTIIKDIAKNRGAK